MFLGAGERECLFPPCSFLEPLGREVIEVSEHGVVVKLRVRLNCNLKLRSCDEIVAQKKTMHLSAFRFLIHELSFCLRNIAQEERAEDRVARDPSRHDGGVWTVEILLVHIMDLAKEVLERHVQRPALDYTDDRVFKGLVHEMIETRSMAESLFRSYLEDSSQYISLILRNGSLLEGHRQLIALRMRALRALVGEEERRVAAERLSVLRGFVTKYIRETNDAGEDPLVRIAADGTVSQATVQLLLAAGAATGGEALVAAATHGHLDAVAVLVSAGVCLDYRSKKVPKPLQAAFAAVEQIPGLFASII